MNTANRIPTTAEFPLSTEVEVCFVDVDAMGHVNNAHYATFFEEARVAYFREVIPEEFSDRELETTFPFILLDLYCRYLSPVRMGERLQVSIRLSRMGGKSFDFEYLVTSRNDGRAVATGRTTQVYFDYANDRTEPVPDGLREAFARIEGGAVAGVESSSR
ncbi:MAG: thioesterase family protein [Thermoanaerobaculales bacterium]|jgi:acyl-CoA thioester hydrolase|nr:thioesterase family protein [Thermoanaerobaculales bacterium]